MIKSVLIKYLEKIGNQIKFGSLTIELPNGETLNFSGKKNIKNAKIIKKAKINIVKIAILNPETKIMVIQVETNNKVCPRSG